MWLGSFTRRRRHQHFISKYFKLISFIFFRLATILNSFLAFFVVIIGREQDRIKPPQRPLPLHMNAISELLTENHDLFRFQIFMNLFWKVRFSSAPIFSAPLVPILWRCGPGWAGKLAFNALKRENQTIWKQKFFENKISKNLIYCTTSGAWVKAKPARPQYRQSIFTDSFSTLTYQIGFGNGFITSFVQCIVCLLVNVLHHFHLNLWENINSCTSVFFLSPYLQNQT